MKTSNLALGNTKPEKVYTELLILDHTLYKYCILDLAFPTFILVMKKKKIEIMSEIKFQVRTKICFESC